MRRKQSTPPPAGAIPAWVRRFDAADWPLVATDDGAEARQPAGLRQRVAWQRQRRRWAEAHGIELRSLIREGRADSPYQHLRG
jgi:hypothetical protein